ncbi:MAG TPA: hypothetical protein DCQ06_05625 [Myxococcales bacterium]|nr:hypothetical protein [Myxococcales bacterium]HAN31059.1 hypothetical protein [Myxococcales bacterium]
MSAAACFGSGCLRWSLLIWAALLVSAPLRSEAHDLRPGALALKELRAGHFAFRLSPPLDGSTRASPMRPIFPAGCTRLGEQLDCPAGLIGTLQFPSLSQRSVKMLVHISWLPGPDESQGRSWQQLLVEGQWRLEVPAARPGPEARAWQGWVFEGTRHIFDGLDHLLFVLGLALLVHSWSALLWALSGFTLAHSLTLVLNASGLVPISSSVTELLIAASLLLLAVELASDRQGYSARHPVLVATLFGLIHGLGFASGLRALAIPTEASLWPLFGFNVGIELGQVVVLAIAAFVTFGLRRGGIDFDAMRPRAAWVRRIGAYGLGLPAGVWTIERLANWVVGLNSSTAFVALIGA